MSFFTGEYECKVDAKGRMILPARLKALLPDEALNTIVINRGFEPCLTVYPMNEWKEIFNKVTALNEFNATYRKFQRSFLRGCTEVVLDGNARVLLPKTMLRYAQIQKEIIVVGVGNRMEIWNPEVYDQYLMGNQDELSEMAELYLGDEIEKETDTTDESK